MSEHLKDFVERSVSRREFLRLAGIAGATVGVGAGMGGLLAACGEEETTTTTAPATTTTTAATTTTTAVESTTTVSAAPETGREVKIGVITPKTGMFASMAVADEWSIGMFSQHTNGSIVMGDGKSHKVTCLQVDTQSDSNRASQVASDLIMNDKVDLILVGGGPDTAMPAADQAETLGTPLLACNCPWEAFIFGRGGTADTAFKWTYVYSFGIEQGAAGGVAVFDEIPTNKVVGLFFANTADTQAWLTEGIGIQAQLEAAGYKTVMPGLFNLGQEDYTSMISEYKGAGCEALFSSNPGTDFPNFWQQALQQGYRPKAVIENALQDYAAILALADAGLGIVNSNTWHKAWPYKDPISGMTGEELAADYEAKYNEKWDVYISHYSRFGWAYDVLTKVTDPDNKEEYVNAITASKVQTICGDIDWTQPVGDVFSAHPHPNVYKTAWSQSQIVKNEKWKFDLAMVAMVDMPGVQPEAELQPIDYSWM